MSVVNKKYERCREALGNLYFASYNPHREEELTQTLKENMNTLLNLIEEHFDLLEKYKALQDENGRLNFNNIANNINDINYKLWLENPPLKFEELKAGDWVWDNKIKQYYQISCVFKDNREMATYGVMNGFVLYEENRYYRKQVLDE